VSLRYPNTQHIHKPYTHTSSCVCSIADCRKAGGRLWVCGLHRKPNPSHPASPRCVPVRAPNHILMYGQASQGARSRLRQVWVECEGRPASFQPSAELISATCDSRPQKVSDHQELLFAPRSEGPLDPANGLISEMQGLYYINTGLVTTNVLLFF